MESSPIFFAVVDDPDSTLEEHLREIGKELATAPRQVTVSRVKSSAPRLDTCHVVFLPKPVESARLSAKLDTSKVTPFPRKYHLYVEVWLPEAAWSGGLSAMSTVYADLFLVMNLSGRRTGWTLESDWLLERLSLPAGSDPQEVIALASPAIATLFRRGRGSGPAHLSESAFAAALASVFDPEGLAESIDDALSGLTGDQKMAFARSWDRHVRHVETSLERSRVIEEFGEDHEAARESMAAGILAQKFASPAADPEAVSRADARVMELSGRSADLLY